MYDIVASPTFKLCLDRLVHFLTIKHSAKLALETKQTIKRAILQNLTDNPHIAPVSDRLIDLGIKRYRQFQVDKHNVVFYSLDEKNKKIVLLAVMDNRQSIQKLLSEVMILY